MYHKGEGKKRKKGDHPKAKEKNKETKQNKQKHLSAFDR